MATLFASDDFNRDDAGSLGANWTIDAGSFDTDGARALLQSGTNTLNRARYTAGAAPPNDCKVGALFYHGAQDSGYFGVGVRQAAADGLGYWARWTAHSAGAASDTLKLTKGAINGTELDSLTDPGLLDGDRIEIECLGTAITVYVNDVAVLSAVDGDYTSGRAAISGIYSSTPKECDNFEIWRVGPIVTPAPAVAGAGSVAPTVILGSLLIPPAPASALAAAIDPQIVLGSLVITPAPAVAAAVATDPGVDDQTFVDTWDVQVLLNELFLDTWEVLPALQAFEFLDAWDVAAAQGTEFVDIWDVIPAEVVTLFGEDIQLPAATVDKS